MLFHTHILLGIVLFLLFESIFSGGNQIIFFFLVLLGSISPDIDDKHSKINQWFGIFGKFIAFFSKHRGLFHSFVFHGILFFIISYFFSTYYAWGLLLGYIAHVLGDGLTPMGVQIFYPFSKFRVRGPFKAGGFVEGVLLVALAIFIVLRVF